VTALLAERDRALLVTANGCRLEIRCTDCGYGGGARLPDRSPMCGARRWQRIRSTLPLSDGPAHPGTSLTTRPGQSAICSRSDST
jgi:hypothetical protein